MSEVLETPPISSQLLAQAKQEIIASGELVRLILEGTRRIDSWLIEQRVVPELQRQGAKVIRFGLALRNGPPRSAALLPLADGSALACSTSGRWSVLECLEALSAIQYVGLRYAPDNHWGPGFSATLEIAGTPPRAILPFDVAHLWQEISGQRPAGFEGGTIDELEALGLRLIGRIFNSQGRLGL